MVIKPETIIEAIIGTVISGLLLALIIALMVRFYQYIKKFINIPLKLSLYPSVTYASYLGLYEIIPTSTRSRLRDEGKILGLLTSQNSSYVSPLPLVISITNTSNIKEPRNITIKEIEIIIKNIQSNNSYLHKKTLVFANAGVQAGGRGSEGSFKVLFKYRKNLRIPLFGLSAIENRTSSRGLRVPVDSYGEICFWLFPLIPGRYIFDILIEIEEQGINRKWAIYRNKSVILLDNFDWVHQIIGVDYDWQHPVRCDSPIDDEYRKNLDEEWNQIKRLCAENIENPMLLDHVRVFGILNDEVYGVNV
jgi:hypothetical protein